MLRAGGWTARRLADELGVGEATAKRWLAGRGLTLEGLDRLADIAGTDIAELSRLAEGAGEGLAQELTLAQERALSQDAFLSFLFIVILGGYSPTEVAKDFDVTPRQMEAALLRLERLALIDRRPGWRVRPLVDRSIVWRKTPMRAMFEDRMKEQFLAMDFADERAVYASEVMKLSAQGAATLAELIEQHSRDVQALAERDRDMAHLPRSWHGMLCAARPLDMSGLDAFEGETV